MVIQKTNMEILNEIRNERNNTIKELGRNDISVVKVEVLGKGENTGKTFYRVLEERVVRHTGSDELTTDTWEMFYEYDEEGGPKLIGVRNPDTDGEIVPIGLDGDEQELWNEEREDIEKCIEERESELKAIAKELGISEEEINSLSEIDLSQRIVQKEEEKKEEKEEEKQDEPKQLSEEEIKKVGMTGMNEVNLNVRVDEKGTELGDVLNMKEYSKIMVVHSYKLAELTDNNGEKGKVNYSRLALIAQKTDGTYETIPESKLSLYRGENREVTEINDKENVETKNEECIFEVPGTNKRLVIDQKDPYGIPDVYLAQNTRDNDGQLAQRLQDRYDGTERTDVEVRAVFNQNRGIDQADRSVEEAREHQEVGCKNIEIDEADGREDTGHTHFNLNSQEQQNAIEEIMEKGKVSREEAEIKLAKELETAREDISLEEATENAIEEIEEEYRGGESRNR